MSTHQETPAKVPQSFIHAKEIADEVWVTGALRRALDTLSLEEQPRFKEWLIKERETAESLLIETERKAPRLTAAAYIKALKAINFDSINCLSEFTGLIGLSIYGPSPEPIYLGSQDDRRFYLRPKPGYSTTEIDPFTKDSDLHGYIKKFRSESCPKTPVLRFGHHLGALYYTTQVDADVTEGTSLQKTPFHLFLQPIASEVSEAFSIWIVMSPTFSSEIEGCINTDEYEREDIWEAIGLHPRNRPYFDCMQIFGGKQVLAATTHFDDEGCELFDFDNKNNRVRAGIHRLRAQTTTIQEVADEMRMQTSSRGALKTQEVGSA